MTAPTPNASGTWASAADVLTYTGVTVTDAQVTIAGGVIDIYSNRTYAMSGNVGYRDYKYMTQAVAYQCAWMQAQYDMFTRLDVTGISEGRRMMNFKDGALSLAPLAKLALDRTSWRGTRSLHVKSPWQDGLSPISPNPDSAANDAYEAWTDWSTGNLAFGE